MCIKMNMKMVKTFTPGMRDNRTEMYKYRQFITFYSLL